MSAALSAEIRSAMARVLADPRRRKFLLQGGLDDVIDLIRFLTGVLPLAKAQLQAITRLAEGIPEGSLRREALSSLHGKAYHVAGACILATFLPSQAREHYVAIVAPLESIYDFLDCLADRIPETTARAVRQLHAALYDALDPSRPLTPYYLYGPPGDDGGYLAALVQRTRRELARLSDHAELVEHFREAARLYTEHQALKLAPPGERERAIADWHRRETSLTERSLHWSEFAAATGSQFHVYGPLYAAFCSDVERIGSTYDAYFPEFAALHVLFDSFIDRAEDASHGELNWLECQPAQGFAQRAGILAARARDLFDTLPMPRAHRFALRVMALFYMTHPKVFTQDLSYEAASVLEALA